MSTIDTIKNQDIIIVGQQAWDVEIGSNCKNIALELSKYNRVLYVNSPLDRASKLKHKSEPGIKKRIDIINKKADGLIAIQHNLWTYYPDKVIESINWITAGLAYTVLNKINNKRFANSIKKAIDRLDFKDFLLFNDDDLFRSFYLKELLKPKISIFYSRDFLLTVDYWKKHGTKLEPQIIAKSDVCVANSVYLSNYCKHYNPNSYYIGQGCDIDEFANYKGVVPDDLAQIKKPVIGYVGALQSIRLDIQLLKYIALQRPDYSIVLVGPEDNEFKNSDLHGVKNIYFLGAKPADTMPAYIKGFDVCLNPQIVNQVTIGNYPRKIDEYLAMGKSVVATLTEGMSVFKDHTYLGNTHDDYLVNIDKALNDNSPAVQKERFEFAATHTWENSVKELYKAIQSSGYKLQAEVKDMPIVIFSNMRIDTPIEATSMFLARSLAKDHLVYYIGYPYTLKDYGRDKNSEAFISLKKSFFNADEALIDTDVPNLKKMVLPLVAPINFIPEGKGYREVLKFNEQIIANRIKKVLAKNGIRDFIFINSFNFYYPGVGKALKAAINVYQCIDPMITPYDLKHGIESELQLVKESDIVICTSKALYDEKIKINPHTYFVPNAADLSHSSQALNKDLPVHPLLKNIPKPIIGYFGSIERRMDYEMLKEVVTKNADKSFVFAGPAIREHIPEWVFNTHNVFLPGKIPYDKMPAMLKGFDIATIPFKKDDVSATIFPLKLFEYLGAGKPVILTDFNPDLKDYTHGTVEFCDNASGFTKAINNILQNDSAEQQALRLKVAQENTWEIRSLEITNLIDKALKVKHGVN